MPNNLNNQNSGSSPVGYKFGQTHNLVTPATGKVNSPKNEVTGINSGKNPVSNLANQKKLSQKIPEGLKNVKKNKNAGVSLSNRIKRKLVNDNTTNSTENSDDGETEKEVPEATLAKRITRKILIKLAIIALPIVGIILLLIVIIGVVSSAVQMFVPFINIKDYGSSDAGTILDSEVGIQYEKEYYAYLEKVSNKYKNSCGIVLNSSYIHAIMYSSYDDVVAFLEDLENFDYKSKIDTIAELMVRDCYVDYYVDGDFYNRLKDSSFFKEYYKARLVNETAKEILDNIFEIGDAGTQVFKDDTFNTYVSDTLNINLTSCNSSKVLETVTVKNYLKGAIYGSFNTINENNIEMVKAYAIASLSNLLKTTSYNKEMKVINVANGSCYANICDPDKGCSYKGNTLVSGGANNNLGGVTYYNGLYYYKIPISENEKSLLNDAINEVFGIVILENETIKQVDLSNILKASNNQSYQQILSSTYTDYNLQDISEDNYTSQVSYKTGKYEKTVVFYDQNDYQNTKFCGRSDGSTIKSSGCGIVAMSIVASTLIDKRYDPITIMKDADAGNYCGNGISGTNPAFFRYEARKLQLNYQAVGRTSDDLNKVIDALVSGKSLVIAKMGPGAFTNGGHYIVLSEINAQTEKVYIYDPNLKTNSWKRNIKNGWYNFNNIVKEARDFYIITRG